MKIINKFNRILATICFFGGCLMRDDHLLLLSVAWFTVNREMCEDYK